MIREICTIIRSLSIFVHVGSWRKVTSMELIRDTAIFEMHTGGYMLAEDNGYFTVGEVRDERTYN